MAAKFLLSRRSFVKTGLLFVPTIFSGGIHGAVRLSALEPEVNAWMGRVVTNGGHYTSLAVVASDTAVKMARSIRSKILRWNLYCGSDLLCCAAPVINDSGSTVDTLTNFVSGDYSQATGLVGNGTTKTVSTGFIPVTHWTSDNDCCMGVYLLSKTSAADYVIGAINGAGHACYMSIAYVGTTNYGSMFSIAGGSDYATGADSAGLGHYMTCRNASNSLVIYKNGVSQYSTATPAGTRPTDLTFNIIVHAALVAGVVSAASNRAFGGYNICKGFSASDAVVFFNAVQRANTILARQV